MGYSPSYAVSYSILSILIFSSLRKETRMSWRTILEALQDGAKGMLMIAVATATAGIISGMFGLTGLGLRFTALLEEISGGSLILALLLTALASFILGMGLPPSASYIVQVAITIPALVVIFNSSNPTVAEHSLLLAHMFVLNPAYLMIGPMFDKVLAVLTGFLGIIAFGMIFQGYFNRKLSWTQRLSILVAGILVVLPYTLWNIIGVIMIVGLIILFRRQHITFTKQAIENPNL